MENLHAPWRIEYILSPKHPVTDKNKSIFTKMIEENDDVKNHVIIRLKHCFAVLNTYPYNGGHLMVVPYRPVPGIVDLTDDELLEMMRLVQICEKALTIVMHPQGFNIGINQGKVAGAGIVEHLHIHVVPRWMGDCNFMPVTAQTHVVSQELTEIALNLRKAISELLKKD